MKRQNFTKDPLYWLVPKPDEFLRSSPRSPEAVHLQLFSPTPNRNRLLLQTNVIITGRKWYAYFHLGDLLVTTRKFHVLDLLSS